MRGKLPLDRRDRRRRPGRARGYGHDRQPRQERRDRSGGRVGGHRLRLRSPSGAARSSRSSMRPPNRAQPASTGTEEPQSETPQGRDGLRPGGARANCSRDAHDDHRHRQRRHPGHAAG